VNAAALEDSRGYFQSTERRTGNTAKLLLILAFCSDVLAPAQGKALSKTGDDSEVGGLTYAANSSIMVKTVVSQEVALMRKFAILTGLVLFGLWVLCVTAAAQEAQDAGKEIERLNALVSEHQKKIEELTKSLQEAQEMIKKLQAEKTQPEARPEPGPVEVSAPKVVKASGKITRVKVDTKSVLIDIGAAAGVRKDDILTVSRAGRILGKIKICVVIDDSFSNAEIVESADGFLPGDDVILESAVPQAVNEVSAPGKTPSPETRKIEEDELRRIEEKLASISERLQNLESAVNDHSEKIAALVSPPAQKIETPSVPSEEQVKPQMPPAVVQAKVVHIEGSAVYISAGTNQGVKEEDVFAIKRDGKVIARVKIDCTSDDMCRGQVISKTANIEKKTDTAEKE
jgi:uncharacterized coiled-coil protein SlyX